ncbi:MAG: multiheme c-type cytochrome, partial [Candidatus Sulfotelmatobacter sp.]
MLWLLAFLTLSAAYLYAFPQPNLFYAGVVLLHAAAGVIAAVLLVPLLLRKLRTASFSGRAGWLLIVAGAVLGLVLIKTGTPRAEWNWMYLHIVISLAGVGLLGAEFAGRRGWLASNTATAALRSVLCLAVLGGIGYGANYARTSWATYNRIQNPQMPPDSMNGEGDGPEGAFFPSSAQVYGNQKIPSKFFMESDSCKRCHEDIYNQWFSSAHHFSSFNNQWYRQAIEYMQDTIGTRPSKWCGGCHDPAVLYSGLMDTPIRHIVHRPE